MYTKRKNGSTQYKVSEWITILVRKQQTRKTSFKNVVKKNASFEIMKKSCVVRLHSNNQTSELLS